METLESPTARALRTLELLQVRPGITANRLAERLGVTDRAARRYIAMLREAGVPVESTRGPYGGYRLGRGLTPPPLVFTATEALGLVMAVLDGHHAAADPEEPVGSALGKLIRALPSRVSGPADAIRRHALAAPDRRAARPDTKVTSLLADAVADHRQIRIGYRSASGSLWSGAVDPWAIVVRHGRWYLLGHAHHVAAPRAYRIDRVESIDPLDYHFEPPADLDPVAWLEEHLGSGWPFETHVVFDVPLAVIATYIRPPMGRLEPVDDGDGCALVGTTNNPTMYAGEWLAAIPHPFRVIGGPELRETVAAVGRRMTEAANRA